MTGEGGADPENLTGVWHGQYAYPIAGAVGFVATLIEFAGSLSGSTHEDVLLEGGGKATMKAMVEGVREGTRVSFVKVYSPANEHYQDVIYEGTLNGDATEIEGTWMVPGTWQGRFLMIRNRSNARAKSARKTAKV